MKPPSPPLTFTRAALRQIDRRAVADFSIPILVLMENAGRAVAHALLAHYHPPAAVAIVCGPGNNGADGLVAARHLHNASVPVRIFLLASPSAYRDAAATQLFIIEKMRLPIQTISPGHPELRDWLVEGAPADLIVDAIFGTGLSRPLDPLPLEIVRALNASRRAIFSIDIPTGLDCDTGLPLGDAIRAAHTISMCGHKPGFSAPGAASYTGKVTTAAIGIPIELLNELALKPPG